MADFKHALWLVGSSSKGSCKIGVEVNKHPLKYFCSEEQPQNWSDRRGCAQGHCGELTAQAGSGALLYLLHEGSEGWNRQYFVVRGDTGSCGQDIKSILTSALQKDT